MVLGSEQWGDADAATDSEETRMPVPAYARSDSTAVERVGGEVIGNGQRDKRKEQRAGSERRAKSEAETRASAKSKVSVKVADEREAPCLCRKQEFTRLETLNLKGEI